MNDIAPEKVSINGGDKVSVILSNFLDGFHNPTITISDIKNAISNRSYGLFMFLLALPCIIPIPTPGLSAVIGLPLIAITFQAMIGQEVPWLPKFISKKEFKREDMMRSFNYIKPYLERLESILKPRIKFLVTSTAERVIAVLCFMLSVTIILPIPFGNALPAFIICLLSLAILTRDGLLVIFALAITAIGTALLSRLVIDIISSL